MLVFSSAEITKSSAPNGAPSQTRWYRSRIGPALAPKLGSRGKTQLRCCQGRRASLLSQRPQCSSADFSDETLGDHVLTDFLNGKAGQGKPKSVREFTGEGLNVDDEAGGK